MEFQFLVSDCDYLLLRLGISCYNKTAITGLGSCVFLKGRKGSPGGAVPSASTASTLEFFLNELILLAQFDKTSYAF